jgi:hypothetical protein
MAFYRRESGLDASERVWKEFCEHWGSNEEDVMSIGDLSWFKTAMDENCDPADMIPDPSFVGTLRTKMNTFCKRKDPQELDHLANIVKLLRELFIAMELFRHEKSIVQEYPSDAIDSEEEGNGLPVKKTDQNRERGILLRKRAREAVDDPEEADNPTKSSRSEPFTLRHLNI